MFYHLQLGEQDYITHLSILRIYMDKPKMYHPRAVQENARDQIYVLSEGYHVYCELLIINF